MTAVYTHLANGIHAMTTPPNAPEVDVLAWIDTQIICLSGGHPNSIHGSNKRHAEQARTAVAAMLTREAALVARNAELEAERDNYRDDYRKVLYVGVNVVADRDRLANENAALREALQRIATGATGYPDRDTQLAEIAQAAIANTPATTGDDAT